MGRSNKKIDDIIIPFGSYGISYEKYKKLFMPCPNCGNHSDSNNPLEQFQFEITLNKESVLENKYSFPEISTERISKTRRLRLANTYFQTQIWSIYCPVCSRKFRARDPVSLLYFWNNCNDIMKNDTIPVVIEASVASGTQYTLSTEIVLPKETINSLIDEPYVLSNSKTSIIWENIFYNKEDV